MPIDINFKTQKSNEMKKTVALIFILCMVFQLTYAQKRTLTGTVRDKTTSEPLPGVTIIEKGTTNGTTTDISGNFKVSIEPESVIVVSFIGMTPKEIKPGKNTNLVIELETSIQEMSEVVVVGYGSQKKANTTGAVASVSPKVLEARPIADVGRGLQGITPGLSVVIPSGEVGSDPVMKIRGQLGSLQGGSAPLLLMDNVEIPSIQMINPDDIESISILKDAASASIYGAKAAFGVVLITTKKGAKTESVNVSYSGNMAFQNISKQMEMGKLDALEYTLSAFERVGKDVGGAFWQVTREGYDKAKVWQEKYSGVVKPNDPMLYGRDWFVDANGRKIGLRTYDPYDYMVKEWAPTQTHNLSVNGKSGKTDYNMSFGYLDQTGMVKPAKTDNFSRYNASIRIGTEITPWLKVHAGTMYSKRLKKYAYATASTTADPWLYLYRWSSIYPMTTEDGDPLRSPASEVAQANTAFQETNYTSLNGGFTMTPTKDWTINFDYTHANQEYINKNPGTRFTARDTWSAAVPKNDAAGNRIYMNDAGEVVPSTTTGALPAYQLVNSTYTGVGSNPDQVNRNSRNDQWNTINLNTTYDLSLADIHKFKFMLGMNKVGYNWASNFSQVTQLIDYKNPQFNLATGIQTASGDEYWESQLGFFGRVNYNFKEKYLFEANLRYDGTSKFPSSLEWRYFPSFSAGWRVNEESWMKWSKPMLSAFKLRGSWGTIGDQTVPGSLYVPTMKGSFNNWLISNTKSYQFATPGAVSAAVTWQDITTLDLGADARFLNSELGFSFDWYQRDTKNMIVPQEGIPVTFGTGAPQSNFGSLQTKGIEIQIDYNHRFKNGIGINLTATLADASTTITKYGSSYSIGSDASPNWYVGRTYGEIWGYETDRLYQKTDFAYGNDGKLVTVTSKDGFPVNQLSDAAAATQGKLQAGNFVFSPGDVKFKDLNGDGVINAGNRLVKGVDGKPDYGDLKKIGNNTPRYEYGFRAGADYKGFDASFFIQGVGKRDVWGDGFLAIPGYNSSDGAIPEAIASDFWRADRTDAFYPAPYNQAGSNNTLNMQVQSRYLLNMAYLRIKNITVGYSLPLSVTKKIKVSKLRVYIALENFFTFDHLGSLPIDPEAISGYSMWRDADAATGNRTGYNLDRTGVGVPTFKSASVGIQLNF